MGKEPRTEKPSRLSFVSAHFCVSASFFSPPADMFSASPGLEAGEEASKSLSFSSSPNPGKAHPDTGGE